MRNAVGLVAGVIIGIGMTFAVGVAGAQVDDPVIHGCVAKNGSLKIVVEPSNCRPGDTAISWNQQGPVGPAGPAGESGLQGLANQQCPAGEAVVGFDDSGSLVCDATGGSTSRWFFDGDGDGWGDDARSVLAQAQPTSHVARGGDCDDGDASIKPDQAEVPDDGIDNNCDGVVDEGGEATLWFLDRDGDGFGDSDSTVLAVDPPASHVAIGGDCDDEQALVNPAQAEVPDDGIDNNCDGVFT